MDQAILLVHPDRFVSGTHDDDLRPLVDAVSALGGTTLRFSQTSRVRPAPSLVLVHAHLWPGWPAAVRTLKAEWRDTPVVGVLGEDAMSSLGGAEQELDDFVCAPVRVQELFARIQRALAAAPPRLGPRDIEAFKAQHFLGSLLGESSNFVELLRRIPVLAAATATVLITGETGTGKELVARAIHYSGPRRNGPFVPCNCGALPDHLLENELFGHAAGAYTDARAEHRGLLAIADGGTLFLDEVDSFSASAQVKLLRFLQDREYRPLGSADTRRANVRVLAATNVSLAAAVACKAFREDLFHRLNVLHIRVPALRDRPADIVPMARTFLQRSLAQLRRTNVRFSTAAVASLERHAWPGNVRELESAVQRATIFAASGIIEPDDLGLAAPSDSARAGSAVFERAKRQAIEQFEKSYLTRLLSESGGNVSRAARAAGKERRTFQRLLRKHGLSGVAFQA